MFISTTTNRLLMKGTSVRPVLIRSSPTCISLLEPIEIIADCQIINEDTLIGLELQTLTPFQFHYSKLWINHSFRQLLPPSGLFDLNLILNLSQPNVRSERRRERSSRLFVLSFRLECHASPSQRYAHGNDRKRVKVAGSQSFSTPTSSCTLSSTCFEFLSGSFHHASDSDESLHRIQSFVPPVDLSSQIGLVLLVSAIVHSPSVQWSHPTVGISQSARLSFGRCGSGISPLNAKSPLSDRIEFEHEQFLHAPLLDAAAPNRCPLSSIGHPFPELLFDLGVDSQPVGRSIPAESSSLSHLLSLVEINYPFLHLRIRLSSRQIRTNSKFEEALPFPSTLRLSRRQRR